MSKARRKVSQWHWEMVATASQCHDSGISKCSGLTIYLLKHNNQSAVMEAASRKVIGISKC